MKDIVSLCKRRGFVFPASEIYGGINGFWDYGPLGTELKNNIRDLWWKAMVVTPPIGPDGQPLQIVGVDSAIIQNPRCWEASGHIDGFNDPMLDCKETQKRYRADHVFVLIPRNGEGPSLAFDKDAEDDEVAQRLKKLARGRPKSDYNRTTLDKLPFEAFVNIIGPDTKTPGTLTKPRQFNMMISTGGLSVTGGEETKSYLRPETCAGIFLNFKNVVDSSRVKVPFGIAQIGKMFRNEVTPRNFIFRTREFEGMELEWFCHKDEAPMWFEFWFEQRKKWWQSVGLDMTRLHYLEVPDGDRAHYSQRTIDIEYRFPFSGEGYDELEGLAHRGNFDLTQHQAFSGTKLEYMDPVTNERYLPDVIEPSLGLTRALLTLLCDAYTVDPGRPSGMYMNFHPSVAPKKAAILPLTAKEDHVPLATKLYMDLREHYAVDLDIKQNIGKRYARQDEIGTPFCFTIDDQTRADQTVTVRHRNTMRQERIGMDHVAAYIAAEMKKIS
ncbi:MAG: glycine--tRNA ligase [Alphaproteobacteria bacterium]|nr:glycine--tRNA ligase [Alphaproteobacteria bacterium]